MSNKVIFDGSCYDYLMRVNGFSCGLNTPDALSGSSTFSLPPYRKRMPYLVDKYPACPSDWMRSEGKTKSYFVPVKEGSGMWLDLNDNNNKNNHVAVVVSVQGINPITGLPCKDAQLEQYIEECPKHKIKFGPDRYCKKCDYKWPKQNYLCTTGTPNGKFWLDGFRSIDGIVRQYILTSEKMKGVASNIIGKDRVFAIGISFFTSKEKKPAPVQLTRGVLYGSSSIPVITYTSSSPSSSSYTKLSKRNVLTKGGSSLGFKEIVSNDNLTYIGAAGAAGAVEDSAHINLNYSDCSTSHLEKNLISDSTCDFRRGRSLEYLDSLDSISDNFVEESNNTVKNYKWKARQTKSAKSPVRCKQLDVSAGAKIQQSIYDDPEKLEFWHTDSEGILCINYCDEKSAIEIIEQGEVNLEGHPEGFLKEMPVGN